MAPYIINLNSYVSARSQFSNGIESVSFRTVSRSRSPTHSATFEDHRRALLEKLNSQSISNNISPNQPSKRTSSPKGDPEEPSKINGAKSIKFQEQSTMLDEEYNKTNSQYTSSNTEPKSNSDKDRMELSEEEGNYIYAGNSGSIHHYEKITSTEDNCASYEDASSSTLIMMTQHEPDIKLKPKLAASKFDYYDDEDDEEYTVNTVHSATNYVPEVTYDDNESEQFKVNVMHHDRNYVSEDEQSYVEDEAPVSFTGYSSQAANIFFGDTAPPPIRPRKMNKINLRNDEDEEEDC